METITFYSYKGGVGRTLALANIAMYLSRFGKNVCIMDFDLEAPGLPYKFPSLIKPDEIKCGLVDYIFEFEKNQAIPDLWEKYSSIIRQKTENRGEIRIIPSGNILSAEYWQKLASINWHDLFYEEDSEGIPFFLELKERIEKEFKPDFLLIDSRTGITEMSGVCTSLLPDKVVFLIVNNRENIDGAKQIFRSIQRTERLPGQEDIKIVFALTRIPFPREDNDRETENNIVKGILNYINKPTDDLESQLTIDKICILHSDRNLELSESLKLEQEGVDKDAFLTKDYLKLFSEVISYEDIEPNMEKILSEILTSQKMLESSDEVERELESLAQNYPTPFTLEKLIDFYFLRNKPLNDIHRIFEQYNNLFGIKEGEIMEKYVRCFMLYNVFCYYIKFKYNLIERYIEMNPNKYDVELRLALEYQNDKKEDLALNHYYSLLKNSQANVHIVLEHILDLLYKMNKYDDSFKIIRDHYNIVNRHKSLKSLFLLLLLRTNKLDELKEYFEGNIDASDYLFLKNPNIYREIEIVIRKQFDHDLIWVYLLSVKDSCRQFQAFWD